MPTGEDLLRHRDNCSECKRLGVGKSCAELIQIYNEHINEVNTGIRRQYMRDQICVHGSEIDRFPFIAEASVKFMSGMLADPQCTSAPNVLAISAVVNAEALWEELCQRFKDDSETDSNE